MTNYFKNFLDDSNHIVGDRFQIGCETYEIVSDSVYTYWINNCGNKVPPLLILEILMGIQPITWISTRHFGAYDVYPKS